MPKHGSRGLLEATAFNRIETASQNVVSHTQQSMLRDQLAYLRAQSKFYQKRLADAGIDWNTLEGVADLPRVPFTTKQDLRDSLRAAPLSVNTWPPIRLR